MSALLVPQPAGEPDGASCAAPAASSRPAGAGAGLKPFEFFTAGLPPEDQFEAWRASYSAIFDLRSKADRRGGFEARHQVWDLGNIVFSHVSSDSLDFASLAGHRRREPLDHWQLSLLLGGQTLTDTGDAQLLATPGTVQLHPLGRPFSGRVNRPELLTMFVPRDLCRDATHLLDAAAFSRLDGAMVGIFGDYMRSVAQRLPSLESGEVPQLVSATRAMLLACVRPSMDRLEEAEGLISNLLLERARRYIQFHLEDPNLNSQVLVRVLGTSRSRLYRIFESSGGVMRYIQRRRLAAAHTALSNPADTRRILEIAESFCFADGAEFSRAFRREFGYSPSDARAGLRQGAAGRCTADAQEPEGPTRRLNDMLRRLQG